MKFPYVTLVALMSLIGCSYPPASSDASTRSTPAAPAVVNSATELTLTEVLTVTVSEEVISVEPVKEHLKELTLNEDRLIVFKGSVNDNSAQEFINKLHALEKEDDKKSIHIVLRSGGGSIAAGFRMIAAMEATKPKLVCVVDEGAYSMAAAIFLHCDKKYIQEHADLMFHEGSLGVEGDKRIVETRVKHFLKQMDELNQDIADQLGIPLEVYLEKAQYEWWLTAEEAVAVGAADQAVDGLKYPYEEPPPPPNPFLFFMK